MRLAWLILGMSLPATVFASEYYQADSARLAQLQAERCARLNREAALIHKRLGHPINYPADIKRMKAKLQLIAASTAQYCPTAESTASAAGTTR